MIVLALGVGSAAHSLPNADVYTEKGDANYIKLREMIDDEFRRVDADLLDTGPGSELRQDKLLNQLEEAEADQNEAIMTQTKVVLEAVARYAPDAAAALKKTPEELEAVAAQIG